MNRTERIQAAERVRVSLTSELANFGFRRGTTSWWYRMRTHEAELVRVLLYRGQPVFRVQGAIRVLNDPFPAIELTGPISSDADPEYLGFSNTDESIRECAAECAAYASRALIPWFAMWSTEAILRHHSAPFPVRSRDALLDALAGRGDPEREERSRGLFGADASGPRMLG